FWEIRRTSRIRQGRNLSYGRILRQIAPANPIAPIPAMAREEGSGTEIASLVRQTPLSKATAGCRQQLTNEHPKSPPLNKILCAVCCPTQLCWHESSRFRAELGVCK